LFELPPHTIIADPVQTPVWPALAEGAPVVSSGLHLLVTGLYRPPVLTAARELSTPPQTIISEPVQMAE
jgi:hypothetical protein